MDSSVARRRRLPFVAVLLCALLVALPLTAAGCRHDHIDTPRAQALAELRYPEDAPRGPNLDILAQRTGREVQLINRTPRIYRNVQLWLNRQYVREVDEIHIGEHNYFHLRSFVNRWQEPFPTARFLAPERRRPLVHAELYDPEADVRYLLHAQTD